MLNVWVEQFIYFNLYSITAQDRILLVMFHFFSRFLSLLGVPDLLLSRLLISK